MNFLEDSLTDHVVEISLHKFEYQIHIGIIFSWNCFVKFDDIWMFSLSQDLDLAVGSLGIG